MSYKSDIPEITLKFKHSDIEKKKITSSSLCYEMLKKMYDADTLEYFESSIAIYLNRANNTIGWQKISQGGLSGTVVDVRIILATALKCGASAIILSHNHPSGNLYPSTSDDKLTEKINDACKIMEIKFLDHMIITSEGYYSYSDEGKIL